METLFLVQQKTESDATEMQRDEKQMKVVKQSKLIKVANPSFFIIPLCLPCVPFIFHILI
jgi:hypothetical protein